MISNSIRNILEKLSKYGKIILEGSVGACVSRTHYEVTIAHILTQAFEEGNGDLNRIINHFKIDPILFKNAVQKELQEQKTGNTGRPVFSPMLMNSLEMAWSECSLNLNYNEIRIGGFILALRKNPELCSTQLQDIITQIQPDVLLEKFEEIIAGSKESQEIRAIKRNKEGQAADGSFLERFTINFVEMAKSGKIDPIFGRDEEISQTIDILSRRRKNNPIMVGEAGVGKTAVVEGLALKIAQNEVPEPIKNVELRSLDMGLLSAGAGVRGEFENRLKGVIQEVKDSEVPVILFIDEAHTMIGAGGEKGQNDAANLLKPELARGELKCLAATTFTEFRKYFEKDPAMARRFQMVNIDEPDPQTAAIMLRGLRSKYEDYHGVKISYEGIKAACELSSKYIAGRQLPDKAVDLLDTAAARVKMGLNAKPPKLQNLEQAKVNLNTELTTLEKDTNAGILDGDELIKKTKENLAALDKQIEELSQQWQAELKLVNTIIKYQEESDTLKETNPEATAPKREEIKSKIQKTWEELSSIQGEQPVVNAHVSPDVVAQILEEWTGIPAGRMVKDEAEVLLNLETIINERIKGQTWGVAELSNSIRAAKTGLSRDDAPIGVFLIAGPSGVGKTEVALTISDLLFGGEQTVVTINMSEYQDSISSTQLKGASAGYVGYGEGGVLTEGVRKNPYSVVILDEIEKAHKDILNMFYQVFDKGMLRDGEGRMISFRNTVIIMTSNLGLDTITQMVLSGEEHAYQDYIDGILPELTDHFQPALLARCKVVPFMPLGTDTLSEITQLKLLKVGKRLMDRHHLAFAVSSRVVANIVKDCTVLQSGARNIDTIIDQQMLPEISRKLLINLSEGNFPTHLYVSADEEGAYAFHFSTGDFEAPDMAQTSNEELKKPEKSKSAKPPAKKRKNKSKKKKTK